MAANKRKSQFEKESQYKRITELYLRGWRQVDIGAELGLSQGMISNDLKVIQARWFESSLFDMNEAKIKEVACIDNLEKEFWEAWEASKVERTKKRQRKGATGAIDASIETEQRDGNPAFLDGVMKCIDRRCKLLGLDAPTKSELTGKDGGPVKIEQSTKPDLSKLSLEELLNLRQMMSKATDGITEPV